MAVSSIDATYQGTVEYVDVTSKNYFDWNADIRSQPTGSGATTITSNSSDSTAVNVYSIAAKGNYYASCQRTFLFFDVSSITSLYTITATTLQVLGYINNSGGAIPVKSTAWGVSGTKTSIYVEDFSQLDFTTTYASAIAAASWNTSGYNNFALNATALSDMNSNGYLNVAIINNTYDQANTTLPNETTQYTGIEFLDGTSDIKVVLTYTTGYGNIVNGVTAANIDNVIGVASADIDNIIGV